MLLLGVDFETEWTSPVDPSKAKIIEIGAVLWDTDEKKPVRVYSELINNPEVFPLGEDLCNLTGLSDDIVSKWGVNPTQGLLSLNSMLEDADNVLAHNGNQFDKIVYESECGRFNFPVVEKHWIDSRTDVPYPKGITTRKLIHLAAEHGVVNPYRHRAVFDVLTMLTLVSMYDIEEIFSLSKEPNIIAVARVTYDDRNLAKERGYQWDAEKKRWIKNLKESQLAAEMEQAPFVVQTAIV